MRALSDPVSFRTVPMCACMGKFAHSSLEKGYAMQHERWLQKPSQNAQVTADPVGTGQALPSFACQPGELAWWWKHMSKDVLEGA